jgi:hypothetical protein
VRNGLGWSGTRVSTPASQQRYKTRVIQCGQQLDSGFLALELVSIRCLGCEQFERNVPADVLVPGRVDR